MKMGCMFWVSTKGRQWWASFCMITMNRSLSRFMIGKEFQGKGYGKQAVIAFLDNFRQERQADKLYISVSLENKVARKMYQGLGFQEVKEVSYTFLGREFREIQMVKKLEAVKKRIKIGRAHV